MALLQKEGNWSLEKMTAALTVRVQFSEKQNQLKFRETPKYG
jgi:hypothetical protein